MDHKASDSSIVTVIGADFGKNQFHLVGLDKCGAIVLRQKLPRDQSRLGLRTCRGAWLAWKLALSRLSSP